MADTTSSPHPARSEGNPRFTIAQLRAQLMDLAESVTGYAPPPKPDRFENRTQTRDGRAAVWEVPQRPRQGREHAALTVRTLDDQPGFVFVEGADFSLYGDWHALNTFEARAFAMALLAAADWTDGHDTLGQRRAQKDVTT